MTGRSRIQRAAAGLQAPRAARRPHTVEGRGGRWVDEYAYLRDPQNEATRTYIDAEGRYFDACMAAAASLRDSIFDELKSRIVENDVSVPEMIHGYQYYTRTEAGLQYPIHCRKAGGTGPEEIYLDENRLVAGSRYCEVAVAAICPRHRSVACAVDRTGGERYEVLVGPIPGELTCRAEQAGDSVAWSRDGRHLLYTGTDDNARPDSVWVYDPETAERRRLYLEADPAFFVSVWASRDGAWILIDTSSNTSSETLLIPAGSPLDRPVVLIPRREDIEYTVEPHGDCFLVLINDDSENFRLVEMPGPPGAAGEMRELIPSREHTSLELVDAYRGHLVITERREGVEYIRVWDLDTGADRRLPGSSALSSLGVGDLEDYEADYVRYEYSTPTTPYIVHDYDVASASAVVRKVTEVPGYQAERYACERRLVPSGGIQVPLTLVYRNDSLSFDGSSPLLLTGYGAYEESVDMEFDSDLVSLLDRGVVAAMAHVRGGGDLGPAWHDAGRLSRKENSFSDFLTCAEYLAAHRYTSPGRIAVWGASAGGLLAAVAVNRRPALFAAAVLEVPFVAVLTTLLDPGLPLTEYDFDEFGDPSVEEAFHWIRAYSPYDNIRPTAYPPMLVTAAMNDQRVGYWEALKWVARLRATKTDDNPLLLKLDRTGHLGESGRYDSIRDSACVYTFLLDMWGLAGL